MRTMKEGHTLTTSNHWSWQGDVVVKGGIPLNGTVKISGSKHSVLNILGVILLRDGTYVIHDFPMISDALHIVDIYRSLGIKIEIQDGCATIVVEADKFRYSEEELFRCEYLRSSILLLGSLLVRNGYVCFPDPGGDDLGDRPLEDILSVLSHFGIWYDRSNGFITARIVKPLEGNRVVPLHAPPKRIEEKKNSCRRVELPGSTKTALAFILSAATRGVTTIINPLETQENIELLEFIRKMGIGATHPLTSFLSLEKGGTQASNPNRCVEVQSDGNNNLSALKNPLVHTLSPDKCEIVFWAVAAALTGGEISCVLNSEFENNVPVLSTVYKCYFVTLRKMGIHLKKDNGPADFAQMGVVDEYLGTGSPIDSNLLSSTLVFKAQNNKKFKPIDLVVSYGIQEESKGIIADASPHLIPLMMAADGKSSYRDEKFGISRLRTYSDLIGIDPCIKDLEDSYKNSITVHGGHSFLPGKFKALNIRDGATKLLYLLKSDGEGELIDFQHVQRAYSDITQKLFSLGSDVKVRARDLTEDCQIFLLENEGLEK